MTDIQPRAFFRGLSPVPLHYEESPHPTPCSCKSICNTPYVIMQSPTTGISFQHLDLLLFPTVGKSFRGNIELQWPRRQDRLGSRRSLVARPWNFYKKEKKKHYKRFFDPAFLEAPWVAALIQPWWRSQGFWRSQLEETDKSGSKALVGFYFFF